MLTSQEYAFLESLFREYGTRLRGHCLRLTASPDLADECVQMTFLAAAEHAGRLLAHPNPAGWLYVTALHMVRRTHRTTARAARSVAIDDPETEPFLSVPSGQDTLDTGMDVVRALSGLGEKDRTLYRRIFEQGMDYAWIAREENTTEAAVKMRAMRLRRKVKKLLEE